MKCPYCGGTALKVVDKRDNYEDCSTRRRRECLRCGRRFTTYERVEKTDISVVKKDGSLQSFDSQKLKRGILKAVNTERISEDVIDLFIEDVERKIMVSPDPVSTHQIGLYVLEWLRTLDPLAYMRFASVYKDFKSLNDFKKELENLI